MSKTANQQTYLDYYNQNIAPKLKKIDIYIKTETPPFNTEDVADLLEIHNVTNIILERNINLFERISFFEIMSYGESEICKIFNRQLKSGFHKFMEPPEISYIYNIDIDVILDACKDMGITKFSPSMLEVLFSKIII